MKRVARHPLVAVGRQRLTRSEVRQMHLWCGVLVVASPLVGFALAPLDTEAAVAVPVFMAVMAGLFLVLAWISPREIWRISESGVSHVRTWPLRRRIRLGWDDITLLCIAVDRIGMRGAGTKVIMLRRCFEKSDWKLAHEIVRACLTETFDLYTPTAWDVECERCRNLSITGHILHWIRIVAIAVGIFASLVVWGFLLIQINANLAFYGSIGLAIAWYCFGAFVAVRDEHSRWRRRS